MLFQLKFGTTPVLLLSPKARKLARYSRYARALSWIGTAVTSLGLAWSLLIIAQLSDLISGGTIWSWPLLLGLVTLSVAGVFVAKFALGVIDERDRYLSGRSRLDCVTPNHFSSEALLTGAIFSSMARDQVFEYLVCAFLSRTDIVISDYVILDMVTTPGSVETVLQKKEFVLQETRKFLVDNNRDASFEHVDQMIASLRDEEAGWVRVGASFAPNLHE